jgi:NTP pyrophosphatase (non-canonical NTP hydrolase)
MNQKLEQLKNKVLSDVNAERIRQNQLYGIQRHEYGTWLGILIEEVGEVAQAINGINLPNDSKETDADNLYEELIHVAAVAVAIAEQVREEQEHAVKYEF